jgi:hypothetical protein
MIAKPFCGAEPFSTVGSGGAAGKGRVCVIMNTVALMVNGQKKGGSHREAAKLSQEGMERCEEINLTCQHL